MVKPKQSAADAQVTAIRNCEKIEDVYRKLNSTLGRFKTGFQGSTDLELAARIFADPSIDCGKLLPHIPVEAIVSHPPFQRLLTQTDGYGSELPDSELALVVFCMDQLARQVADSKGLAISQGARVTFKYWKWICLHVMEDAKAWKQHFDKAEAGFIFGHPFLPHFTFLMLKAKSKIFAVLFLQCNCSVNVR